MYVLIYIHKYILLKCSFTCGCIYKNICTYKYIYIYNMILKYIIKNSILYI